MKNLMWLAVVVCFAACSKNADKIASPNQKMDKESCDFGLTSFNLTKRPSVAITDEFANKNPHQNTGSGGTGGTGTTTPPDAGVILLDFDGQVVTGTAWNTTVSTINCAPANLTGDQVATIVNRVANDYSAFNIVVTTDEAVYNAANLYKKQRVIVTESWEWYGQAGGVSFLNTFTQGTNTPCFVFSSLLGYNTKYVAEACSHEAGHTLGLRHQSLYDANCVKTTEYNAGQGSGEIGWAPIMGNSYYKNLSLWHKGPNSVSCSNIQDDIAIIASKVGYKTDDYSNGTSSAASLSSSLNGVMNSSADVDFFAVNTSTTKTVSLVPYNVGVYNDGANEDLVLNVYSSNGALLSSINDPNILNAGMTLAPGSYYISVSSSANIYTTNYGMLGLYNISVN